MRACVTAATVRNGSVAPETLVAGAAVLMSGYLGAPASGAREGGFLASLGVVPRMALAVGTNEVLRKPLSARELATSLARVLQP
jgi:hypothetical protein